MSRYEPERAADAAAGGVARELVRSIRGERLTRLLANDRAGAPAGEGRMVGVGVGVVVGGSPGFRAADLVGVAEMVEHLRRLVFPGYFDPDPLWEEELEPHVARLVGRVAEALTREVRGVLRYREGLEKKGMGGVGSGEAFCAWAVGEFLRALPRVREMLALDVQAAYDGDPAAEHTDETILCYPGIDAIFAQRVAHVLYNLGVPLLPRVISEQAHSRTGIDVHPGAKIGESFFIDHGTGVVIGETSVIGKQCKVYQGVTLGARSFPKDERGRVIRGIKRHPTLGDRVTVYAGAVVLGGDTVIGDDCVIAGGVFVTGSVPPGHVVQQTRPELVLRPNPQGGRPNVASGGDGGGGTAARANGASPAVDVGWLADGAGI